MKIIQATFGVFHQFELARELDRRGHLDRIYSTFPWQRLKREGVAREKVESFPWIQTPAMLLGRYGWWNRWAGPSVGRLNARTFDRWIDRRIPECDALIAISNACLVAAQRVQSRGGLSICDRGSTHRRFQARIVEEEYRLWGQTVRPEDEADMAREEQIYQEADAIVVPSSVSRESFLQYGYAPEKLHTIPSGVLLERFSQVARPPSAPNACFEVLFVGGVTLRKGIPYLLEAFARFRHPHKRLRILGMASSEMKPLLDRLPRQHVEFLGHCPQSELSRYMSTSHVLVLPSVEDGLALVQGQAMACGCPVIATTATGAADLFTDGVEGFILPIRSIEAIVERLERLAGDPALRERMSQAALERVRRIGGWRDYGDRWEALLGTLAGRRAAAEIS